MVWTVLSTLLGDTSVYDLLIDGTDILAGTRAGVFRSTDDGVNWTELNNGLTQTMVRALAKQENRLYAGTEGGGVFVSTDGGDEWTPGIEGLSNKNIRSLFVTGDNVFAGTWVGGVFLSTDQGDTWEVVNEGLSDNAGQTVAIVQSLISDGTYLFAGTRNTGVWRRPLSELITAVEKNGRETPGAFMLHQNYPNPFNAKTTIRYQMPHSGSIHIGVFDLLGREITVLVDDHRESGMYTVEWDATGFSSGLYIITMGSGDLVDHRKVLLMK